MLIPVITKIPLVRIYVLPKLLALTQNELRMKIDTNNVPIPNRKRGRDIKAFGFIPDEAIINSRVAMVLCSFMVYGV